MQSHSNNLYKNTGTNCPFQSDKLSLSTAPIRDFAPLPPDVLSDRELTPASKLVFGALAFALRFGGSIVLTYNEIAIGAGITERQVKRSIPELIARQWVKQKSLKNKRAMEYTLTHPFFVAREARRAPGVATTASAPTSEPLQAAPSAAVIMPEPMCRTCGKSRRLSKTGDCYPCLEDQTLRFKVKYIRDRFPDMSLKDLTLQVKQELDLKRMGSRLRRIIPELMA